MNQRSVLALAARLAGAWALLIAVLTGLGLLLPDSGVPHVDRPIDRALADHRTGALISAMKAVTTVGAPGWVLTASGLVAVVLFLLRRRSDAVVLALVVLGADAGDILVKAFVRRARPPVSLRVPHVSAHGLSFPSGHATIAAAGIGTMTVLAAASLSRAVARTAVLVVGTAAALVVGFSRLYLGVHWPTDVVGGWLLSATWLVVVVRLLGAPRRVRPA